MCDNLYAINQKHMRNSTIEVLRLLSMLMIVSQHYVSHGFSTFEYSMNMYFLSLLDIGGQVGVSCFVLISAYFTCESTGSHYKKILGVMSKTHFYSWLLLVVFLVIGPLPVSIKDFLRSIAPIGYKSYWFISSYLMLMLVSPALNKVILAVSKKQMQVIILLTVCAWSILKTMLFTSYSYSTEGWFVLLYFIGAYVRKYSLKDNNEISSIVFKTLGSFMLLYFIDCLIIYFGSKLSCSFLLDNYRYFHALSSPFILINSYELFMLFVCAKPRYNKMVNLVSNSTIGVYLIHDNFFVRKVLWNDILNTESFYYSPLLPLHAIISILGVFLICTLVDVALDKTIQKIFVKLYNSLAKKLFGFIRIIIDAFI